MTRVARREGLPPLHVRTSAPAPTEAQKAERTTSLQNQIRYAFAIQPHAPRRHLENNDWDVIEAADALWEEEESTRNRTPLPEAYEVPMGRNVETSQLHARTVLSQQLKTGSEDITSYRERNTALFGLLQRNH